MSSGCNNFNYFPESKLTRLTNFCSLCECLCFVWRIESPCPHGYATVIK